MTKININGIVRDMTSAEETQLAEDRKILADAKKIRDDERTAKETNKANAKAKLQAAEYAPLTEDEADTIVL